MMNVIATIELVALLATLLYLLHTPREGAFLYLVLGRRVWIVGDRERAYEDLEAQGVVDAQRRVI